MSLKKVTLSCPASEMITNKDVELSSRREDWLHLVKAEQVRVVLLIFLQHNFFFAYLVGNSKCCFTHTFHGAGVMTAISHVHIHHS